MPFTTAPNLLEGGPFMNQHSVSSTIVAGWVVAALLSLPTGADAAPKPAPKPSSGNTCESAFKQTRPASTILDKVLQSHARWLEDRTPPMAAGPISAAPTFDNFAW
jgi:hypothetical protein